jgi:hypothetical protein
MQENEILDKLNAWINEGLDLKQKQIVDKNSSNEVTLSAIGYYAALCKMQSFIEDLENKE